MNPTYVSFALLVGGILVTLIGGAASLVGIVAAAVGTYRLVAGGRLKRGLLAAATALVLLVVVSTIVDPPDPPSATDSNTVARPSDATPTAAPAEIAESTAVASDALVTVTNESPPEAKLASLDAGEQQVPRSNIAQMAQVLDKLEQQCKEGRSEIGDLAVVATQGLNGSGHPITIHAFLVTLTDSIPDGMPAMDCKELGAAIWTTLEGTAQ